MFVINVNPFISKGFTFIILEARNHAVLKGGKSATQFGYQFPQSTYPKMFCPSRGHVERMPEGRTV
jgi:hypothetical protein